MDEFAEAVAVLLSSEYSEQAQAEALQFLEEVSSRALAILPSV
jgi:hypothetical protein